ncbi:helix-turn-helix domain-containing protein [Rhizobium sp.]
MEKKAASNIDCFRMIFPESDPNSALNYGKMMMPVFEFEALENAGGEPFSSDTGIYCLPDVTVTRVETKAARFTRTVRTIARSATDEILVVCYMSGHFTYRIGDTERRVESGEFAVFDLAQEVVIEAPFVDNVSLAISRRRLEAVFPLVDSAHGFVMPSGALAQMLLAATQQVVASGAATQPAEARPISDALILLVGALFETLAQPKPATGASGGAVSVATLKAAIERKLGDRELGPQTLLDEFGMTRSTLYRAFEPLGGVSAYINERRLRRAFRIMTNATQKDLRLSQLAFDLGFAHASAFTRAFKARYGLTPTEIRTLTVQPPGEEILFMVSPEALPYIHRLTP